MSRETLADLHDRYLARRAELDPLWATEKGIHKHDHRLTTHDDASRSARRRHFEETLRELDALEGGDPLDRQVLRAELETALFNLERWDERTMRPDLPLEAVWAIHDMMIKDYAPREQRIADATRRMKEIPEMIRECRDRLERPPAQWVRMAIDDLGTLPSFFEKLEGDDAFRSAMRIAAKAYADYREALEIEILPRADGDFAVGAKTYNTLARLWHALEMDAAELHKLGRREFDRTRSEMESLAREISADETVEEIIERTKANHPTSEALRATYVRETERAKAFLVEHDLVGIPEGATLELIDTPGFFRTVCPYAAYSPPAPLDTSRIGHFYVTPAETEEQLRGHSYPDIENTVLHEAYPGHHLQLVYAKGIDSKIRRVADAPTLCEGWGLYCEELGHEAGYYSSTEARLMALNWKLHRAARVILDVSLHTGKMETDDAVTFLVEQVHLQKPQAISSVNSYTQAPTYFMSYLVGMLELKRMREAARARVGSRFTLREFHERVLRAGNAPVGLLSRRLKEEWR